MYSKIEGNILEHLRKYAGMKEETYRYFRSDSELYKAIENEIMKNRSLIDLPDGCSLKYWRGTGPISFKDAFVYAYEHNEFAIRFDVSFVDKDDYDDEYGDNAKTIRYQLDVPKELELNFDKVKFQEWVAKKNEEREFKKKEEDMKILKKLLDKYGPEAKKMLK